jgi:hypothetical protein
MKIQFGISRTSSDLSSCALAATPYSQQGGTWQAVEVAGILYDFATEREVEALYDEDETADRLNALVEQIENK